MTDREKLLDLLQQGREKANKMCGEQEGCEKCPYQAPKGCAMGIIAAHILASDFINCLQNEAYDLGVDSILHHKFGLSWDDAAELRKEVARLQTATKWIPVAERLPETAGKYLVCANRTIGSGYIMWLAWYKPKKGSFYIYDSEWGDVKLKTATHWMPMPKLPKEVE